MLPLIVHVKVRSAAEPPRRALILTPHQPAKDDICTITKPYLEAADVKCQTLYESESKDEQLERLKASSMAAPHLRAPTVFGNDFTRVPVRYIRIEFDLLIANPSRLLDICEENQQGLLDLSEITFLIVDEYIQFRKMQTMDLVKKCVELLRVAVFCGPLPVPACFSTPASCRGTAKRPCSVASCPAAFSGKATSS